MFDLQHIEGELFGTDGNAYAIVDGAAISDLPGILWDLQPEFECLYRGDLPPDVGAVAPYLVRLKRGTDRGHR